MENRSALMEDFCCIRVDHSMKSMNFEYKATLMCKWSHPHHTLSFEY